jgi:hypothetical protein
MSKSHGDSNWCTPHREKHDQYTTRFPRSVYVWSSTIRISRCPHIAPFCEVINSDGQNHCSSEKGLPTQSIARGWLIYGSIPSFSPKPAIEAAGVKPPSVDGRLLGLLGLYHQHAIGTFNTNSWGPTHRSLTDTGRGYNLRGVGLPYHTPRPSHPTVLPFPTKGPARSLVLTKFYQLNQCLSLMNLWLPRGLSATRPSTVA